MSGNDRSGIVDFAVDNIERLEGLLATGRIRADT
jgi:hypothetical protein